MLGHIQRGGTPTAFDRVLATRLGLAAVDAAHAGQWGQMTALHATEIELVTLADAVAEVRAGAGSRSTRATASCSAETHGPAPVPAIHRKAPFDAGSTILSVTVS